MTLLLACENMTKTYGTRTLFQGVSFAIHSGERIGLIGPNGSGKTTLVRALLGLQRADRGRVHARSDLRIGYVPQRVHIEPTLPLTVVDFLRLGSRVGRARCEEALAEVGVARLIDAHVRSLSGGEFQRMLLARALLREPDLLVLDEPAQGVDIGGQRELYRLIARLRDQRRCAVLLVSHDLHLVMAATDRVVCLNGHVCCRGEPDAITADPEYRRLFGPLDRELAIYTHGHDHHHGVDGSVVPHSDEAS
jgi:zinc transport system ATP-binding protein